MLGAGYAYLDIGTRCELTSSMKESNLDQNICLHYLLPSVKAHSFSRHQTDPRTVVPRLSQVCPRVPSGLGVVQLEIDLDPGMHRTGDTWHVSLPRQGSFNRYGYRCKVTHLTPATWQEEGGGVGMVWVTRRRLVFVRVRLVGSVGRASIPATSSLTPTQNSLPTLWKDKVRGGGANRRGDREREGRG